MQKKIISLFLVFLFLASIDANEDTGFISEKKRLSYPLIPKEIWNEVYPYLIPENHRIKPILDELFANPDILDSIETLKSAGFEIIENRRSRKIVIARHPKLKDYIFKAYLDEHSTREWSLWVQRAKGARMLQEVVIKNNFKQYFKVPRKWIYPLARKSLREPPLKNFVLVVSDARLVDRELSASMFRNRMTLPMLKALFKVLLESGYSDCHHQNLPFCIDGRIAFIDAEHTHVWPVHFEKLTGLFSPPMQKAWNQLIRKYPNEKSALN